jgi:Holliday junction resolvasome RuvABC DNA-binding subunit
MITSINGKIILVKNNYIVVESHGVGYKIFVGSYSLELREGQEIFI